MRVRRSVGGQALWRSVGGRVWGREKGERKACGEEGKGSKSNKRTKVQGMSEGG